MHSSEKGVVGIRERNFRHDGWPGREQRRVLPAGPIKLCRTHLPRHKFGPEQLRKLWQCLCPGI
jgi:hypothetical protein